MLKVGITGGIGSGKTTVCRIFELLGIPVFYADDAARSIMEKDSALITAIRASFGDHIYPDGTLDRTALAASVFEKAERLATLNALVHPATIAAADKWFASQTSAYAIKEAALFFEGGSHKQMNIMIGVSAPVQTRIERVMLRSVMSRSDVQARIDRQMDDAQKMSLCDYVVANDDHTAVIPQVLHIHRELLAMIPAGQPQ